MGYYANGSGYAKIKEGMGEALQKKIKKHYKGREYYALDYGIMRDIIDFYDDEKYHNEDTMEFLDVLSPYITEGIMNYSGEDDCIWRFRFDPKKGKWIEEDAIITYGFESFSDEKMIKELEKRGYTCEKKGA